MMKKTYLIFISFLITILILGCKQNNKDYRLAASNKNTSSYTAGQIISNEIKRSTNYQFKINDSCNGSFDNIKNIMENRADFAIIQNTLNYGSLQYSEKEINNKIRTVVPLYSQILFVIYHDSIHNDNIIELFKGRRIGLGPKSEATDWFVKRVLSYFGLKQDEYTAIYTDYPENMVNDNIDISCSVTSFNNKRIQELMKQPNLRLFSFDQLSNVEIGGSTINSLSLRNTTLIPRIIPKYTYFNKPETPILTVSTNAILVCRADMDEEVIYEISQSIFDHKSLIVNTNPIFNIINENFSTSELRFPLHTGVKMYLDRAKPGFLEKYAEVMALLLTITVLLFGAFTSLNGWQKQRKKDRVDVYYQKVIDIDQYIEIVKSSNELQKLENQLFSIRNDAFDLLINEKLSADDSFNIFLNLLETSFKRIQMKAEEISK